MKSTKIVFEGLKGFAELMNEEKVMARVPLKKLLLVDGETVVTHGSSNSAPLGDDESALHIYYVGSLLIARKKVDGEFKTFTNKEKHDGVVFDLNVASEEFKKFYKEVI